MEEKITLTPCPQNWGQGRVTIFNILKDLNKIKILLIFIHKGFTWHRELKSFGLSNNVIEKTLNDLSNSGLIKHKELWQLDSIQYETIKTTKPYIEHYYNIFFTHERLYNILEEYEEDIKYMLYRNPHLIEFIDEIKEIYKPFVNNFLRIEKEENNLLVRTFTTKEGIKYEVKTKLYEELFQKNKKIIKQKYTKIDKKINGEIKKNLLDEKRNIKIGKDIKDLKKIENKKKKLIYGILNIN